LPIYQQPKKGFDGFTIAALALFLFIGLSLIVDSGESSGPGADPAPTPLGDNASLGGQSPIIPVPSPTAPRYFIPGDQTVLAAPYSEYIITQGAHGLSYGHAAIDISGGKSAAILSPINGVVSENYTDQYGNTTLILDNNKFKVTFLHGNYSVRVGEKLIVGQTIGTEGNNGYTTDMSGRLCTGRDCGYHSHLNVFDKELGSNINPLDYFN
jgi:murein DD-endopeptidase MepM/ murein hydrolase activator NlpD